MKRKDRLMLAIASNVVEVALVVLLAVYILPQWDINIPVYAVVIFIVAWLCVSVLIFRAGSRALAPGPLAGLPDATGLKGVVVKDLAPEGVVKVKGELWKAWSENQVPAGYEVKVVSVEGMKLKVQPLEQV